MLRLVIFAVGTLIFSADPSPAQDRPAKIPDPSYQPSPGDTASVLGNGTAAAITREILDALARSRTAGDVAAMDREVKAGNAFLLPAATPVEILAVHGAIRVRPNTISGGIPLEQMAAAQRLVAAEARTHPAGHAVEARIAGGPLAGRRVFLSKQEVGRMIDDPAMAALPSATHGRPKVKPRPVGKPASAAPVKPADPADRAASSLQLGKNLRFDGNRDAAAEYFRQAVKAAPDSPAGREAAGILKAMGIR